jgi:hypothetical protein
LPLATGIATVDALGSPIPNEKGSSAMSAEIQNPEAQSVINWLRADESNEWLTEAELVWNAWFAFNTHGEG